MLINIGILDLILMERHSHLKLKSLEVFKIQIAICIEESNDMIMTIKWVGWILQLI